MNKLREKAYYVRKYEEQITQIKSVNIKNKRYIFGISLFKNIILPKYNTDPYLLYLSITSTTSVLVDT